MTVTAGFAGVSPSGSGVGDGVLPPASGCSPASGAGAGAAGLSSSLPLLLPFWLDSPSARPTRPTTPNIQPYSWYQAKGSPVPLPSSLGAPGALSDGTAAASSAKPSVSCVVGSEIGTCSASAASLSAVLSISTLENSSAPDSDWSSNCNSGEGRSRIFTARPGNSTRLPSFIATTSTPTIAMALTSESLKFSGMRPSLAKVESVLNRFFMAVVSQKENQNPGPVTPGKTRQVSVHPAIAATPW